MKQKLRSAALDLVRATGRYRDWSAAELRTRHAERVSFRGDIPPMAGSEHHQHRLVLDPPRPRITQARHVLYTRRGMAWVGGALERRYSFQEVGPKHVFENPGAPTRTYARASILQAQTPYTYGDWMSEHVAALSLALLDQRIVEPLLLPQHWFSKAYVQRDLAIMGIRAEGLDSTVLIEEATVINKTRHSHFWARPEVEAVAKVMGMVRRPCEPGTALYLSRKGQHGEGPQRQLRNDITEAAMERSGVKVVRTSGLGPEEYQKLAGDAETVFFDHGSAGDNLMYWQTRRVVEFVGPAPNYWDPSFLFLSDCLDIHDYHIWQIGPETTVENLSARIEALRSEPWPTPTPTPTPT